MTDPIEVYTRQSVDGLIEPINQAIATLQSSVTALTTINTQQDSAIAALQAQTLQAQTIAASTTALADQASANLSIALGKNFMLYGVASSAKCRLRLYRSAAYRSADQARLFGIRPSGEHGLLLDLLFPAGNLQWDLAPIVWGSNSDSPRTSNVYAAIQNLSGIQQAISLNFSLIPLGA